MAEPGASAGSLAPAAAPASRGPRRSPTTGHVRRRYHTPEKRPPVKEDDTTEDSEEPVVKPRAKSVSAVPDERGFSRISTSEDDEEWQSRRKASAPESVSKAPKRPEKKKEGTGILRKLSSEKIKIPEKLEERPKSVVRKRVRSKSRGRQSPEKEGPTETPSATAKAKAKAEAGVQKASAWWKLGQGPLPSNKQVSSIDPQEVLRGLIPETKDPEPEPEKPPVKKRWFSWFRKSPEVKPPVPEEPRIKWYILLKDIRQEWKSFKMIHAGECRKMKVMWNRCMSSLIVMMIFCGLGAFLFRFIEGAFESFYKCGVKRVKRDFIDSLWTWSRNTREDEWKMKARRKLWEFEEELHTAHEAGVTSYSGQKSWSFLNSFVYCLTIVTTIGYGHISPVTTTGRAVTILYAIIGIPLFLILLADFGKLFTRSIKFVWSFVRRLFYTGSCRKVRRTQPVQSACGIFCAVSTARLFIRNVFINSALMFPRQLFYNQKMFYTDFRRMANSTWHMDVMKGVQMVYDLATFRRPSQMYAPNPEGNEEAGLPLKQPPLTAPHLSPNMAAYPQAQYRNWPQTAGSPLPGTEGTDTPTTPAPSAFEVDDEFNLPITVAITILLIYMFVGATIYYMWEDWGFFESFYFVFVSMSTIGFGDFVPQHPMYMMASIVYLVFGLALTSMCINVVQEKLSDTFRQASAKIGATIGLRLAEEESAAAAEAERAKNSAEAQEPDKTEQQNNTSSKAIT